MRSRPLLPDLPLKKDISKAPPESPRSHSSNFLPVSDVGLDKTTNWKTFSQRNVATVPPVETHLLQADRLDSTVSDDSGIGSSEEVTPPSSHFRAKPLVKAVPVTVHEALQGPYVQRFPVTIKVEQDDLIKGKWQDEFYSGQNSLWIEISLVQGGQSYIWKSGEPLPSGIDVSEPFSLELKPTRAYENVTAKRKLPAVSSTCQYKWHTYIENDSVWNKASSVYHGERAAAVLRFPSSFDPFLAGRDVFPGVDARVLHSPFDHSVTVVLSRRDDPGAKLRADRLEALVRQEWRDITADINRGVPENIAHLQSKIRILPKYGEQEFVHADEVKNEVEKSKQKLALYNQSLLQEPLTPAQQVTRERAMKKRVLERFNMPAVTLAHLQSLASRYQLEPDDAESVEKSAQAQQVHQAIVVYEKHLEKVVPEWQVDAEKNVKQLLEKIENLQRQLTGIVREQRAVMIPTELDILQKKIDELEHDKELLFQVLDSPARASIAGKISWQGAMEYKRVGYNLDDTLTLPGPWRDELIDPASPPRELGRGAENTVYLVTYKGTGGSTARVFKPEAAVDESAWIDIVSAEMYHDSLHPNLTARNLATGSIARQLGMNVMPGMSFCEHNHRIGLEMELAPGSPAASQVPSTSQPGKMKKLGMKMLGQGGCSEDVTNKILAGLVDLELLDAICAQPDRHPNNFFIDYEKGQVTGIDNDTCLYPFFDIIAPPADDYYKDWRKGCRVGYPRLMTRSSFETLQKLDVEAVCESLPVCFNQNVKDALKNRIHLMQRHGRALEGCGRIVDDWASWKHPLTGQTAGQFLTESADKIVDRETEALREEENRLQPVLDRHFDGDVVTPEERAELRKYFRQCQLLKNDETNKQYAVSNSYLAMTVY